MRFRPQTHPLHATTSGHHTPSSVQRSHLRPRSPHQPRASFVHPHAAIQSSCFRCAASLTPADARAATWRVAPEPYLRTYRRTPSRYGVGARPTRRLNAISVRERVAASARGHPVSDALCRHHLGTGGCYDESSSRYHTTDTSWKLEVSCQHCGLQGPDRVRPCDRVGGLSKSQSAH